MRALIPSCAPRARRLGLVLAGLLAGACILSPVEDLPSGRDGGNGAPPNGTGGGVVIDPGNGSDGDPGAAGAGGEGGLSMTGLAGAGGAADEADDPR